MKNYYTLKTGLISMFAMLCIGCQTGVYGQIDLNATGGTSTGSYPTISAAFNAINAGTHTGNILISVNGNTTEPASPVILAASGQGLTSYTGIGIKPSVIATISGATTPGAGVINLDGADNVTIDGSITIGGTSRDLTIQNTAAITVANVACIRLIGRTTFGLGATNITIANCNITGNTSGNNGLSGSTVNTSYGVYAGSTTATTMAATSGGADYDNLTINNNFVSNAYIGINVIGLTGSQADNLVITDNTIGSLIERIGFKGFTGQHLVGGNFTNNVVTGIEATTSISVAGVDVAGSATVGFQIRRNTITDIHQFSTGGYGAYGVNITGGAGVVIANNSITGVQTLNYANGTTYQAFGIRITTGTGHQIYYNSVNMYGDYTTGSLTNAFSAALCISSTTVTGLDIRNNIFANSMTSTATSPEFLAVSFPTAYNFSNANLERNAYMVTADANHYVGKTGTAVGTNNFTSLNDWMTISQVGNASNDLNSFPTNGNSNAPFTSNMDLTIPAATVTLIESGGLAIPSLGLPNVDRTNINRPAGTGTNPDLGAFEFEGLVPSDIQAPVVSLVVSAPGTSCTVVAHTVTATVTDDIGVTDVILSYSYDGVPQIPITMILSSGTALNGTYAAVIPAAAGLNVNVTYSVQANDALLNMSISENGPSYTDDYLVVTASADQLMSTGVGTSVFATTNDPSFGRLMISEIIQYKTGTGQGTYPAYIPVADNDFLEIVNFGNVDADASGYTMTFYGSLNATYTIPANTIIPSGGTMVLAFSGTASDPGNNYFGMNIATISSTSAVGYVLRNPLGEIKDVVATNSYTFTGPSGVTSVDWSGTVGSLSGLAGVRRTAASDNNISADWTPSGAVNLMNIGVYNTEITIVAIPTTISWTTNFDPSVSNSNPLPVAPFASPGTYTFYATFNDGICTAVDSVVITAVTPVAPVASFSATPLVGSAPLIVNFTDLSSNLPDSWAWTVSPMTGVTYISATTSSSQNPVIQFDNAGTYTITLWASNIAGSDDLTIIQYINVNYCLTNATNSADSDIGNVTFGLLNNGTASPIFSNPSAVSTYTDYTALPVQSYITGESYPISLSQITGGATFWSAYFNVFIDYNNDGSFDPITERVFSGATAAAGPISNVSGSVTIPLTAFQGIVNMRVVLQEGGSISSPPCGTYGFGETEDYLINIMCSSVAPASNYDVICSGETSLLTASGNSIQWYSDSVTTQFLSAGSTYLSGGLTSNTSFYATSTDPGCAESASTEFIVTVNEPSSSTQTIANCGSYVWPLDGLTYTGTGIYSAIIPNTVGCDSLVTLNLTITNVDNGVTQSGAALLATELISAYQWLDCDNNFAIITGAVNQIYTPSTTGNYAVEINKNGCIDTSACILVDFTGMDEMEIYGINVYPNPSLDGQFSVTSNVQIIHINVLDLQGRVLALPTNLIEGSVDGSVLKEGKYIVQIVTENNSFIKEIIILK